MYEKLNFKDRIVEKPNTYTVQTNDDGTVTLIPAFGNTLQEGTAINHGSMDHIEEGILQNSKNIDNLKSNIYIKDNYAILEGVINIQTHATGRYMGSKTFNYPKGFTKDNSVVISTMLCTLPDTSNESYNTSMGISSNNFITSTLNVTLFKSEISVTAFDNNESGNHPIKIIILRYKD